jgi:antitoxin HigA-1
VRLSKVFGGSAQSWLTQQAQYDLAQVPTDRIKLKRYTAKRAAAHAEAQP